MPNNIQLDLGWRHAIDIVLVSPRNPLNIGAVARAMANFGFSHLTVVAPYEPHWREAKSAIGAEDLLQSARITETLGEALSGCTFVLGTASLANRQPEQPVIALHNIAPRISDQLMRDGHNRSAMRIALVFGSEKRGLTREDLALCHALLTIPTSDAQPSMNLAQAVAVCLYEIAAHLSKTSEPHIPGAPCLDLETWESKMPTDAPATSTDLDQLAQVIDQTMQAADYSPAIMQAANRHDTNLLLRRLALSNRDARRILGLFRRVLWRLKH